MTTPGSSRTSASSDGERRRRSWWLAALVLYAVAAAGDMAVHLDGHRRAGKAWFTPSTLVVAFSAGLFWPVDLVAGQLLAR